MSFKAGALMIPVALDPVDMPLPLVGRLLPAGFPSPADDYLEGAIDISAWLIDRPAATYLMRVNGDSMKLAGILDGDTVAVDKSVQAVSGHIVVAVLDGDFTVKRLRRAKDGRVALCPENPDFPVLLVEEGSQLEIWGVVIAIIRKLRP